MTRSFRYACLILPLLTAAAMAQEQHGPERDLVSFQIWEMIWSLVTFGVFFLVLSFLVWPKILKALQAREGKIRGDLQHAERASAEAQKTLEDYRAQVAGAQKEAAQIVADGRKEAQRQAAVIQEQARKENDEQRRRAAGEIAFAKESALSEVYAQTAVLSTRVAQRILGREIKPDDHRRLVDEAVAQLKKETN